VHVDISVIDVVTRGKKRRFLPILRDISERKKRGKSGFGTARKSTGSLVIMPRWYLPG
jgi:hypothetical protein